MTRIALGLSVFALAARVAFAQAPAQATRVWEINGIRLEPAQVERLADDMAARTVSGVRKKIPEIALRDGQAEQMRAVYRNVALDVFAEVVTEVARADQTDAQKETRVRELVLAGQSRSHAELASVLDANQLALYSAWEDRQVEAFKNRRWNDRRRRR
ncbi:MAG: hypothetical protein WEF50_13025 [Myxococcota bacterium]